MRNFIISNLYQYFNLLESKQTKKEKEKFNLAYGNWVYST